MADRETARSSVVRAGRGSRSVARRGVVTALGIIVALGALASCGTHTPRPGPPPRNDQEEFRADVARDRGQLLDGRLDYASRFSTPVGVPRTYQIQLSALGGRVSGPTRLSPTATDTRAFRVGGAQGATLTATSADVRIEFLADPRTRYPVTDPGDIAQWSWTVSASEPGDYDLHLGLTTYQRGSDLALHTLTPAITVRLHVTETWSYRVNSMLSTILAWGGAAVALTALLAFRTPITAFARTRRLTWQERHRDGHRDGYR